MELKIYSAFQIGDYVLGINLENNRLEALESTQLPPKLKQLFLANNKFKKLPMSIFKDQKDLKEVTLSGNPWQCDCDTVEFKEWLTSEKAIVRKFLIIEWIFLINSLWVKPNFGKQQNFPSASIGRSITVISIVCLKEIVL